MIREERMPIFSYLAYPAQGVKDELLKDLNALDHCEAMAVKNEEILILVTDTPNEKRENVLKKA